MSESQPGSEGHGSSQTSTDRPAAGRPVAVIDIGASAIRLVVAELVSGRRPTILEEASRGVLIGQDTFSSGRIGAPTIDAAVRALGGFRGIMDGYGVGQIRAVATSAVREAANADTFLDRVRVQTGIDIEIIDGSEESRLTYLAVRAGMPDHAALTAAKAVLVEVGGGSTSLTALRHGQPAQSGVYPLGAIRLRQRLAAWYGPQDERIRLLTRQIANVIRNIGAEINLADATHVIAVGSDMRFAASCLTVATDAHKWEVPRKTLLGFCDEVGKYDEETLVARLRLSQVDAETLVPAMLVYRHVLLATAATAVTVPDVSLRAGLLVRMAGVAPGPSHDDFRAQVLVSAAALGAKYHYDEAHARIVARLATRLFDELAAEHALNEHDRLLLEVASLLHDIGLFVSLRGHHKHSLYLLQTAEIFGLSHNDMLLIGNIARYHRRGLPQHAHPAYSSLTREARVRINKLAALLRLANALDAEHLQKVGDVRMQDEDGNWILDIEGTGDLTMERLAATSRADLLTDVFGKRVILRGSGAGV
jgi:exopolyphosphatase / guanosine-5'-triphosphate,3'-diphosphate pyrophosphatase